MEQNKITVKEQLLNYIAEIQVYSNKKFQTEYKKLWDLGRYPIYTFLVGKKYYKIIEKRCREDQFGSAWAFVSIENGDIFKPASYNSPAKKVRGNIFNDKRPLDSAQLYIRL